jgi:3-oxoacyl-[acyl-carrier-protein] synthase II
MSKKNRVAITGIGLVTPLGNTVQSNWENLIAGKSGLSFVDYPQLKGYPYRVFGLVKNEQELLDKTFCPNKQRKTDRFIHLAILAGHQAMQDSGLTKEFPVARDRFGVLIGVGIGGLATIEQGALSLNTDGVKKVSPFLIPKVIINQSSAYLSMDFDLQGPMSSMVNACSSSGDSIGYSFRMIRDGYADYMLTGGAESCVTPLSIAAFGNMRAICAWQGDDPTKASRPFDKDRAGFIMSEGAGILVLERMDLAQKRGAQIYAEVVGFGSTSDAFHITAMHPEGRGACKAIEVALHDAQVDKEKIGYINAHGTSTKMNDSVETLVLKKAFGSHVDVNNPRRAVISSTKSMTGHLLGAAGGTEVSYTALALKNNILPPTINLETPDPECDLDYIPNQARQADVEYAISNSFGFGGGNAVVVLKKV